MLQECSALFCTYTPLFLIFLLVVAGGLCFTLASAQMTTQYEEGPIFTKDQNLKAELFFKGGLKFPTSMAFLDTNDILVLEKNEGKVKRIVNGIMLSEPLLDVDVANERERGMLGIAVKNISEHTYVFLYFTEAVTEDGDDLQGKEPLGNRLYRYELVNDKLLNPKLLLDLPAMPEAIHNGGKVIIGPDNNIYIVTADNGGATKAQNYQEGSEVDGRSGIIRITQDGGHVPNGGILSDEHPLNLYYAYGIRNSFGIAFDPVTGNLWDTENGENDNDEINLVEPGFNSGWSKMQGIVSSDSDSDSNGLDLDEDLVNFNGKGEYRDPKFTWQYSVGPTDIKFLHSEKYGKQYENDVFVGDFHKGYLYHFDLDKERTELSLKGLLNDRVANSYDELKERIFARGFGGITDIEVGPDGYIYILSLYVGGGNCDPKFPNTPCIQYSSTNLGSIFRIVPTVG